MERNAGYVGKMDVRGLRHTTVGQCDSMRIDKLWRFLEIDI